MTRPILFLLCFLPLLLLCAPPSRAQPSPAALAAFRQYTQTVDTRMSLQHRAADGFLAPQPDRKSGGQTTYERLTPEAGIALPGAQLHHWRATTFIAGAHLADFETLLRDLPHYPGYFAPEVLTAHLLGPPGPAFQAVMRVRQKHILTVVLDATYNITLGRLDPHHGFSSSRSTRIDEIAEAGTAQEHALPPDQQHGFLWAQNTWWSYAEQDVHGQSGLLVQIETLSLSRSIPAGLGWAVRPFVQSIPRDSLAFTLDRTVQALHR